MQLRVLHQTEYHYPSPVVLAQHSAHLTPLQCPGQTVKQHLLSIDPLPAFQDTAADAFGNLRTLFTLQTPHEHLRICADSRIDTDPVGSCPDSAPWDTVGAALRYRAGIPYDPASEYLFASPYVVRDERFADFARPAFVTGRPWLEACEALMHRIHTELQYETASTDIGTPALQALAQGKGVCQDFAHIMIGCLRSLGLPARYVSGYLLTQPPPGQPRLIGADASHAWVSVPWQGRWYDFDPTNDRCGPDRPGEDYVTLAWGRDFGDVSPLRGVIQGGGGHTLTVAVTVAPVDECPSSEALTPAAPT